MDPDGLDANYFYGDFLMEQNDYRNAQGVLTHALQARVDPNRPVWEAGRRAEVQALLDKANRSWPISDQLSAEMNMWHAIGRQFRNPTGLGGRMMGSVMGVINRRPNRLAIEALDLQPGQTVLEIGCGPGAALHLMHRMQPTAMLHGLDQSETMLAQARRRNRAAIDSGKVALHRGAFERLPFGDGTLDRILAVNVVYFWTDLAAVLGEIQRVLCPGGRVALYATDASAMRRWRFAGHETHRLFDAFELEQALKQDAGSACSVTIKAVRGGPGVPALIATMRFA